MSAADQQAVFAAALLDASLAPPPGLATWNGSDPAQRFAIYRNNVAVSLGGALAENFPVVRALVGAEFFAAMARGFFSRHPPVSPLMAGFGADFPAFIAAFEPAAHLAYLADVAALEAARIKAYHAGDAAPLAAETLAGLEPSRLFDLAVDLHPSAQILASRHAVFSLWAAHQGEIDIAGVDPDQPEDVLVARPRLDVEVTLLPPGGAAFFRALGEGAALGQAALAAHAAAAEFDLGRAIWLLFAAGVAVNPRETQGA